MTTKELIKLLQQVDPDGNTEVVFCNGYNNRETITGVETYNDSEVQIYQ